MTNVVNRKRVTNEEVAQVIRDWELGVSRKAISENLGRSENTVREILKRLQREGKIRKRVEQVRVTESHLQSLSTESGLSMEVLSYLLPYAKKRGTDETLRSLKSLVALWKSQRGRCYYTNVPLGVNGVTKAELVRTSKLGSVFVTSVVKQFRGELSHTTFLKMVNLVATQLRK